MSGFRGEEIQPKREKNNQWKTGFWLSKLFCQWILLPGNVYALPSSPWQRESGGKRLSPHLNQLGNDANRNLLRGFRINVDSNGSMDAIQGLF